MHWQQVPSERVRRTVHLAVEDEQQHPLQTANSTTMIRQFIVLNTSKRDNNN